MRQFLREGQDGHRKRTGKEPIEVVLLGRKGCHLCDAVEAEIRSIASTRVTLRSIDIDKDPLLRGKYWLRIPVVIIGRDEVLDARMIDPEGTWKQRLMHMLGIRQKI